MPKNNYVEINSYYIPFLAIMVFSLLNGFFNSIMIQYGTNIFPYNNFLFLPSDRHADLINVVSSFSEVGKSSFLLHNPYGDVDALNTNSLNHFFLPPLVVFISLLFEKLWSITNINIVLFAFYSFSFLAISFLASYFKKSSTDYFIIFFGILLSYPVLFALSRGHIFSFISSIAIILLVYNSIIKKNTFFLFILFAIAVNIKPNAIVLLPLFLIFETKNFLKNITIALISSILLFILFLLIDNYLYPQYTLGRFIKGLGTYYHLYVLNHSIQIEGGWFSNSLLTAIKFATSCTKNLLTTNMIAKANNIIAISLASLVLLSSLQYIKRKMTKFEFLFLLISFYVLMSSVYATYHLMVFLAFILSAIKINNCILDDFPNRLILFTSVFLLIPKNYLFCHNVSYEMILNPMILFSISVYILYKSIRLKHAKN